MTRKEMLEKLFAIDFRAAGTVQTMDMGLEFDYMSSKGCGTCFGSMGDWPAYKIRKISPEAFDLIRKANQQHADSVDTLSGTDLQHIAKLLNRYEGQKNGTVSEMVDGFLQKVKDPTKGDFYCLFDSLSWDDKPVFFDSYDAMIEEFDSRYTDGYTEWDDLEDSELENWYSRMDDNLSEMSIYEFTDEKEEYV